MKIQKPNLFRVVYLAALVMIAPLHALADDQNVNPQVMMIGVFHFANPGLDTVKTDVMNVMDEAPQAYLDDLARRIVEEYRPTRILLEYRAEREEVMQERYAQYLAGAFEATANENYQLGFRIGKVAGGIPIEGYDESYDMDFGKLMEVMPQVAPDIAGKFQQAFTDVTAQMNEMHATMSLQEILQVFNTSDFDLANKGIYLMLNQVASEGNYEGANVAMQWWGRNFRMYANIQRAAKPGERILVIGGQGHTAILKDFAADDNGMTLVDVRPLL